ncbi:MAG: sulfide/dihydroorotate dehydrogenase-like FAD/NAD-binding protein [Oscillospiraceae bacterium]|nr:sulfide/dihydroorotate dehydrogenase-like FAD/NAD-binding protein [Oscillospiraceae bacterium]
MFKILRKRVLNTAGTTLEMVVEAPLVARKCLAGQFIIFRLDEFGERIPLTIADYDRERGTVTIMFQPVGRSTIMLSKLNEGDYILDFVGPLGKPTEMEGLKRVAVVGGGVGCAIAYPVAKAMHAKGIEVDMIAGFRSKDIVMLEPEMRANCTNLYITTDDGSYAEKGFVTDKLKELIESGRKYDEVVAIGPGVMMKYVSLATKPYGIKTTVSLNPIMIDGTGMCGGCRVSVGGETKFACVDGPEFDGHLVDWDELLRRGAFYKDEETEQKEHICHLTGGVRHG